MRKFAGQILLSCFVVDPQAPTETKDYPLCEPCEYDEKISAAIHYCENCDENMCDVCLEFHNVQEENRDHTIFELSNEAIPCAICTSLGRENSASSFCIDCGEQKPLCNVCAKKHQTMKKYRDHKISTDMDTLKKR